MTASDRTAIIAVAPSPLVAETQRLVDEVGAQGRSSVVVRRPTCGIQLKQDTYATLRIISGGANYLMVDAGSRRPSKDTPFQQRGKTCTDVYSNFLLQQVSEERMEKSQALETFGDPYIFLFGERARMITFSGVLVNTFDFNWESEWWYNYENFLRGTRCVETDSRAYLTYDNVMVGGYVLAAGSNKMAQERNIATLQFQMFVTSYTELVPVGDNFACDFFNTSKYPEIGRPKLIDPLEEARYLSTNVSKGKASSSTSLADSLRDTMKSVASQAKLIKGTFDFIKNGVLYGVRIPIGFAGSMVYDEKDTPPKTTVTPTGQIAFLTRKFQDNDAEYVTPFDQYAGSTTSNSILSMIGYQSLEDKISYGRRLTEEAVKKWGLGEGWGTLLDIEKLEGGPIGRMLARKAFGLTTFVAGKGIQAGMYAAAGTPLGGLLFASGGVPSPLLGSPNLKGPLQYLWSAAKATSATTKYSKDKMVTLAEALKDSPEYVQDSADLLVRQLKSGPPSPSELEETVDELLSDSSVPGEPGSE